MSEGHFTYDGELRGHRGWVTAIAAPLEKNDTFITASRDGTLLNWKINERRSSSTEETESFAIPLKRLEGHSSFVQDVALSSTAEYALSASWDKTIRLWSTRTGTCQRVFRGHTNDVLSVAFSPEDKQVASGGRDQKLKVWDVDGKCIYTYTNKCHQDWITCVRFSPRPETPFIVSGGSDHLVKLWSVNPFKHTLDFTGHTGYVSTVCVSPDGSLCASGGKDGTVMLWDIGTEKLLYQLETEEIIHAFVFSPNRYWLCAATESCIRIWDLETKKAVAELAPPRRRMNSRALKPECISLTWSADGNTLYTGHTDNTVHIFGVRE